MKFSPKSFSRLGLISCSFIAALLAFPCALQAQLETQSLAGEWKLSLSDFGKSDLSATLPELQFTDTIHLPATTETAGKGPLNNDRKTNALTAIHRFVGKAWYERSFIVPDSWKDQRLTFFIERSKCTQVWLDGRLVGSSDLLSTCQLFELGTSQPGVHRLTVLVDNSRFPIPGWGENHEITEHTQGNWNGLLGRLELQARGAVGIQDAQVFASALKGTSLVRLKLRGDLTAPSTLSLKATVLSNNVQVGDTSTVLPPGAPDAELKLPVPTPLPWDEFHPNLYQVVLLLSIDGKPSDQRTITFAFRDFDASGARLHMNGTPIFLRGKHDGCVFPLTGHPPMDVTAWREYLRQCQSYGINHLRFHSWTPPDAAFQAADELGVYIQTELPFWGTFTDSVRSAIMPEADAILQHYGNHPSFVMLSLGNENRGSREIMAQIVDHLRKADSRHLYAQGSNNTHWAPKIAPQDDYWVSGRLPMGTSGALTNIRGSFSSNDRDDGHVQVGPSSTQKDYSAAIAEVPMPVVSHEIGQYTVSPDFSEISRYTGVFRAYNLEAFRAKARGAGLLDRADLFFRASGKLAAINYREEIEAALRTPGFGGFQILDLQDYPGQGTALVGLLNAFMQSKGAITPEEWRQFCSPKVILARFDRYELTCGEIFSAKIELAHFGPSEIPESDLDWRLLGETGETLLSGALVTPRLGKGRLHELGRVSFTIPPIAHAMRGTLVLSHAGAQTQNRYPIWLYPKPDQAIPATPEGVTLVRVLDSRAQAALAEGRRVLLVADDRQPLAHQVGGGFTTDFWCWPMFKNKPGTMGLCCDPTHPALAEFPTEYHSDMQWFTIAMNAQALILDSAPPPLVPIVEVIDNLERAHRLGLVFEVKVAKGSLLVCAVDLLALSAQSPSARQLLRSLLHYANSDRFAPKVAILPADLSRLLQTKVPNGSFSASSSKPNRGPARAADNNDESCWDSRQNEAGEWWRADFNSPENFSSVEIVWARPLHGYGYVLETSQDEMTWTLIAEQQDSPATQIHILPVKADAVKHIRIRSTQIPAEGLFSLGEVRFLK